ncbi:MAG: hypothetical protein ABFE01_00265 [Phycisphaerales bacterium]|jgi:hypothetical protein
MSTEPYNRKQGEFELRILKDGRLVMIAPDEMLLEIAASLGENAGSPETTSGEQNAEKRSAGRQQVTGPGRDETADG